MSNNVPCFKRHQWREWGGPALVVVVGLVLTLTLFSKARRASGDYFDRDFQSDSRTRATLLEHEINSCMLIVESLRRYVDEEEVADRGQFPLFAVPLIARRPEIKLAAWVPAVSNRERQVFERQASSEDRHKFTILERSAGGQFVSAKQREMYYPIRYPSGFSANRDQNGFDLGSDSIAARALARALDRGEPAASQELMLPALPRVVAVFAPVFEPQLPVHSPEERRNSLRGFVLVVVDARRILASAVQATVPAGFDLELLDLSGGTAPHLLSRWASRAPGVLRFPRLYPAAPVSLQRLPFAGRDWALNTIAKQTYLKRSYSITYWLLLPGGGLLTLLLALYIKRIISERMRLESDLRDRQRAEQEILYLNRIYALLSQVNQTIVHSRTRQELLDRVCRVAVEHGGFRMVWIALAQGNSDGGLLRPAASCGEGTDHLSRICTSTSGGTAGGCQAMARAFRENRTVCCNDILGEPCMASCHARAREYGYGAAIVLPLRVAGQAIGAFHLHLPDTHSFRQEEMSLLEEVASDISYALEKFAQQERIRDQADLLDMAHDAIIARDQECRILYWNRGAERLYGWTAAEAIGRKLPDLLYRDFDPSGSFTAAREQLLQQGEWSGECRHVTKDGKEVVVSSRWTLVTDTEGYPKSILSLDNDVTAAKQMEEQLRQSQKMQAMGVLAGGVAHDFNNLICVIKGYSEIVAESLAADDPNRKKLEQVIKAGERAAALTRQLLAFSRKQVLTPKVLDLHALVGDLGKMLLRLIGEDVQLKIEQAVGPCTVQADPGQLEQVILNLVVNARDAMPQGGNLVIATGAATLGQAEALSHGGIEPGKYAVLTVRDEGTGMSAETLSRIFEPFFTTKEQGRGTGLGLSTVYGIVKQSGGHIEVDSAPGRGTTFTVYLPMIEVLAPSRAIEAKRAPARGSEVILLAEDLEPLRVFTRDLLASYGYCVLAAADGAEALELVRREGRPVDLLVTDVVMPGISGRQLAERLAASFRSMKVIYVSGYTDDAIVRHGVMAHGVPFLQKPFSAHDLATTVRQVLDGQFDRSMIRSNQRAGTAAAEHPSALV